jgi:hypothetical protein
MIGLLMLVGEVVRGSVVPSRSTEPKTASKSGCPGPKVNGPAARRDVGAGGWFAAPGPRPASGEPR